MIQDAGYKLADNLSVGGLSVFPSTSTYGKLSDYLDLVAADVGGGRTQYLAVEINTAIDTNFTIAAALWPDNVLALKPEAANVYFAGHRYISQLELTQTAGECAAGKIHYLPLRGGGPDMHAELVYPYQWRYLNLFLIGTAGTSTGAVTCYLTDAMAHSPQRFVTPDDNRT